MEDQVIENNESIPQSTQELTSPKCTKFDPFWVQALINLRMKHSKLFTRRRNSASEGWKLVYQELKDSGAPEYVTITKIKKKWMNLMTRYRQIKNTTLNPESITWPYFEQIDRSFGREIEIDLFEGKCDSSINYSSISNDERQSFIRKLIELRHNHRHLFTGRKYTARDGWISSTIVYYLYTSSVCPPFMFRMPKDYQLDRQLDVSWHNGMSTGQQISRIIQTLLQCQGKYSIDQLSKCWQNLVQRYKQLSKNENTDTITWPYFECMKKWFSEEQPEENSNESLKMDTDVSLNITENENTEETAKKCQFLDNFNIFPRNNISMDCIKIQLLSDIKIAQEKYHNEITDVLKNINNQLNILISENSSTLNQQIIPENI